jgi:hypothetical protein
MYAFFTGSADGPSARWRAQAKLTEKLLFFNDYLKLNVNIGGKMSSIQIISLCRRFASLPTGGRAVRAPAVSSFY